MLQAFSDEDEVVRSIIASALDDIGEKGAVEALIDALGARALKYLVTIRGSKDASFTVNAKDLQEASSIVRRTNTHHQGYSIKRAPVYS